MGVGNANYARMTIKCRLMSTEEFASREEDRISRLREIQATFPNMSWSEQCRLPEVKQYLHAEYYGPGTMWYCPWYYDPAKEGDQPASILSSHYMNDWSKKRPPLMVICPDGKWWCVDQKASNGAGWIVTGDPPNISCTPSIDTETYHGFLKKGEFTDDLAGRTYGS